MRKKKYQGNSIICGRFMKGYMIGMPNVRAGLVQLRHTVPILGHFSENDFYSSRNLSCFMFEINHCTLILMVLLKGPIVFVLTD